MRRVRISIVGVSLILVTTSLLAAAAPSALAAPRRSDSYRHAMYRATNHSRINHRVGRLKINAAMSAVAQHHSAQMAKRGYLFHTSDVKVYLAGVAWHAWGENVGYTQGGTVNELEAAFMHSPVHRDNILNGAYRHVAIGTVIKGGTMWVTVFFYG